MDRRAGSVESSEPDRYLVSVVCWVWTSDGAPTWTDAKYAKPAFVWMHWVQGGLFGHFLQWRMRFS
jgi:hypothetical protein